MQGVVSLHLHRSGKAVALRLDQRTDIQLLNPPQPVLPRRAGQPASQMHHHERNRLTDIHGALEAAGKWVFSDCREPHAGDRVAVAPWPVRGLGWRCVSDSSGRRVREAVELH